MITPDSPYFAQVRLLVRVLPVVARERCFALKGGTAINLFVRDMPRLSVDIDLAFVPLDERAMALVEIDAALGRIAETLRVGHTVTACDRASARKARSAGCWSRMGRRKSRLKCPRCCADAYTRE